MSGAKHTPGPWKIDPQHSRSVIAADTWEGPEDWERPWYVATAVAACGDPDASEANARLIAAAPDLLDALKELRFVGNDMEKRKAARAKAGAAIARATDPAR